MPIWVVSCTYPLSLVEFFFFFCKDSCPDWSPRWISHNITTTCNLQLFYFLFFFYLRDVQWAGSYLPDCWKQSTDSDWWFPWPLSQLSTGERKQIPQSLSSRSGDMVNSDGRVIKINIPDIASVSTSADLTLPPGPALCIDTIHGPVFLVIITSFLSLNTFVLLSHKASLRMISILCVWDPSVDGLSKGENLCN